MPAGTQVGASRRCVGHDRDRDHVVAVLADFGRDHVGHGLASSDAVHDGARFRCRGTVATTASAAATRTPTAARVATRHGRPAAAADHRGAVRLGATGASLQADARELGLGEAFIPSRRVVAERVGRVVEQVLVAQSARSPGSQARAGSRGRDMRAAPDGSRSAPRGPSRAEWPARARSASATGPASRRHQQREQPSDEQQERLQLAADIDEWLAGRAECAASRGH